MSCRRKTLAAAIIGAEAAGFSEHVLARPVRTSRHIKMDLMPVR